MEFLQEPQQPIHIFPTANSRKNHLQRPPNRIILYLWFIACLYVVLVERKSRASSTE